MGAKVAVDWSDQELDTWKPSERLLVSQFAERDIVLAGDSAEKGDYRLRRVPFFRPVMDCTLDPDVETVVLCKSAQIGGSYATYGILAYYSNQEPRPCLVVMADQDTSEGVAQRRLKTIFEASPNLSKTVVSQTKRGMTFTTGARAHLAWASSVAGLATFEYGLLILDEIDKPGYYVTSKEASPISLAIERTETYYNRKILMLSTPTQETGNILSQLDTCDAVFDWHVPCPYCGVFQPLRWSVEYTHGFKDGIYRADTGENKRLGHVVWEGGRRATREQILNAGYQCGSCEHTWNNIEKNVSVQSGKMVPRKDIEGVRLKKVGFHLNRLYSMLGKSGDIPKLVEDFISCLGDPRKLQGFVNSALAEPWKLVIHSTSAEVILKARVELKPKCVPQTAIALTCGVDAQKYGFYFAVRAWQRDLTSWLIDYGQLPDWIDLENLFFNTSYPVVSPGGDETGDHMRIWRGALDTGGGDTDDLTMTEKAYFWLRKNGHGRGARIFGTKGASQKFDGYFKFGSAKEKTFSGKPIPGGLQIVLVDTDSLKDTFHSRLTLAIEGNGESRAAYLHSEVGIDYANHVMAEEKRRNEKGIESWVQVRKDNHLFDADLLSMACADPYWPTGGINNLSQKVGGFEKKEKPPMMQNERTVDREEKNNWFPEIKKWF